MLFFFGKYESKKKEKILNMLRNSAKFDKKIQYFENICTTGKDLPIKCRCLHSCSCLSKKNQMKMLSESNNNNTKNEIEKRTVILSFFLYDQQKFYILISASCIII